MIVNILALIFAAVFFLIKVVDDKDREGDENRKGIDFDIGCGIIFYAVFFFLTVKSCN